MMELLHLVFYFISIALMVPVGHARYHHHHHHHDHDHQISAPPSASASALPPAPSPDEDGNTFSGFIYDVRMFGGVGDGVTDDTEAFKIGWENACQTEAAVLLVPYGYIFMIQSTIFTGPCQHGFVFRVEGTIRAPEGPEWWARNNSRRQWLVFYRVNEISLVGGGLIDGRGQHWWDLPCKPHKVANGSIGREQCDSPIAIRFMMSKKVRVEGMRMKDSPQFHLRFDKCEDVHINSVHITAPPSSPNTDGIHIHNTNNVQIYNSLISNGDDCVSIGSGCYDVDIRNLTCGPGHGISIGSLGNHKSRACAWNITVRESVIKKSENGVRIKTWQGGSGGVWGVRFEKIRMDNVRNPIIIDQFYCLARECSNRSSAVYVSDIRYSEIKGTYDVRSPPVHLACSDSIPCTNITIADVDLLPVPATGALLLDPFCWNAYGQPPTSTIPPLPCLASPPSILQTAPHLIPNCSLP